MSFRLIHLWILCPRFGRCFFCLLAGLGLCCSLFVLCFLLLVVCLLFVCWLVVFVACCCWLLFVGCLVFVSFVAVPFLCSFDAQLGRRLWGFHARLTLRSVSWRWELTFVFPLCRPTLKLFPTWSLTDSGDIGAAEKKQTTAMEQSTIREPNNNIKTNQELQNKRTTTNNKTCK